MISIIIPVYNTESTLYTCVNSVQKQTFCDWELLLVDDGSKDNSLTICRELAESDERIHVLHQEHQGVSAARNFALSTVCGDYVCFIDSDDSIETDYLENLYAFREYDLVVCGYFVDKHLWGLDRLVDSEKHVLPCASYKNLSNKKALLELFESGTLHMNWNKLFHLAIIKKANISYHDYSVNEDFIFVLEYLKHIQSLYVIDRPLYHWKRYEGRLSGVDSIPSNMLEIYNKSHLLTREFFNEQETADKILYYSYNMLVHKYMNFMMNGNLAIADGIKLLCESHSNILVKEAYNAYHPHSQAERFLYWLEKYGFWQIRYAIHRLINKWKN